MMCLPVEPQSYLGTTCLTGWLENAQVHSTQSKPMTNDPCARSPTGFSVNLEGGAGGGGGGGGGGDGGGSGGSGGGGG